MSKTKANYNKRFWLNNEDSEATGSVVAFEGIVERWKDRIELATFLEIADCNNKIVLHQLPSDNREEFIQKMRLLSKVVTEFADFLDS